MARTSKLRCIVPSYVIKGRDFHPILKKAKKGEKSWHYPTHIAKFLANPLPLFFFDEIFIDEKAFEETLNLLDLRGNSNRAINILSRIPSLQQVKLYDAAQYIGPKVPYILDRMIEDEKDPSFEDIVGSIEHSEGQYAVPDNYHFELINMNITSSLIDDIGNAVPYDRNYRCPLYERMAVKKMSLYQSLEKRIVQFRKYCIGQPPLKISEDRDIQQISREHGLKRSKALREKIRQTISSQSEFDRFLDVESPHSLRELSTLAKGQTLFMDTIATFASWEAAMSGGEGWGPVLRVIIYVAFGLNFLKNLNSFLKRSDYIWCEGLKEALKYVQDQGSECAGTAT